MHLIVPDPRVSHSCPILSPSHYLIFPFTAGCRLWPWPLVPSPLLGVSVAVHTRGAPMLALVTPLTSQKIEVKTCSTMIVVRPLDLLFDLIV